MIQSISAQVTVFYIGFVATILTAIWLLIEYASDSDQSQLRIFKLDWNQIFWCLLCSLVNSILLASKTIAYANERPGLITMVGYIGLVYGFLVDTLYLEESFTALEIVGVVLILAANVTVICSKQNSLPVDDQKKEPMSKEQTD